MLYYIRLKLRTLAICELNDLQLLRVWGRGFCLILGGFRSHPTNLVIESCQVGFIQCGSKKDVISKRKIEWIIYSIYGVKIFHSLRSEFHSILTPVEWKFTTQRVKSRPVHSIFIPKEVITDVTTQGVKTEWIEWFLLESKLRINPQFLK